MKYMKIGSSDVEASVISLGAWSIGGGSWWKNSDDDLSVKTVHRALDLGITLIDTAPIYGLGHSEEVIGRALKGRRNEAVLSTKATFDWDTGVGRYCYDVDGHGVYLDHSYAGIVKDCENSMKRLGTDYIDVFYLHNPAKDTEAYPVEESARALMDLKKSGKIRAIGLSNVQPEHVREYMDAGCQVDIIQRKYSMLERSVEGGILPLCRERSMSFHAYSPLERGLLTGGVSRDYKVPAGDARDGQPWWAPERLGSALDFVDGLEDICRRNGCTRIELAVAFLRSRGDFVNVICGAHKPEQIEKDVGAADVVLSNEDVTEIERRIAELEASYK